MSYSWEDMYEKARNLNRDNDTFSCDGSEGEKTDDISLRVRVLNRGASEGSYSETAWLIREPNCPHYSSGNSDSDLGKPCNGYGNCSNLSEYYQRRDGVSFCRKASVLGDYNIYTGPIHISGACGAGDSYFNDGES